MPTIRRNFGDLTRIPLSTRAVMREIGLQARELIVSRTRKGVSSSGAAFQGYSPGYQRRKGAELGSGVVNLTVSGAMLNGITLTRVTEDEVELGFSR